MSYPVLSIAPETPLSPAITYLINENISCLPVVDNGRLCGVLTTTDLVLTLQCTLQLWLRLAQVLQHDTTWTKELDKIAATLDGNLTAAQLQERTANARQAMQQHVQDLVNAVDLGADVLTGMSNRRGLEEMLEHVAGGEEAIRAAVFAGRGGDRPFPAHQRELRRRAWRRPC